MQNGHTDTHPCACAQRGQHCKTRSRKLILILILAVFGLFGQTATADELSLLINGKAIHFDAANKNFNEKNWGAGFQYDWAPVNQHWIPFAMASGFKDSNRNPSYYAGGGMMRRYQFNGLHFEAGAIGFLMIRKDFNNDRPFIGVLPAFSVGTKRIAVNMTYIPKVEPKAVPLVFFQLKINLSNLR